MKDSKVYVEQILDSVRKIESFTFGMNRDAFADDEKTQSATIMQLALIGELSKKIPEDRKEKVGLPWKDIAGFRDMAIHDYFQIDIDIVWDTIRFDIPTLKEGFLKIL